MKRILLLALTICSCLATAQSMLSLKTGFGIKSETFGFPNDFSYESLKDNVKSSYAFSYGLDYQYGFGKRSSVWANASFVVRDISYQDIILKNAQNQEIGSYDRDVLQFIDLYLGYAYQLIDTNLDLYIRIGGGINIPADFKAELNYTGNTSTITIDPALPDENIYGAILEPVLSWKPSERKKIGFTLGLPVQFFWVENPTPDFESTNPSYTLSVALGVFTELD
jgi:hypothetical protein